MNRVTALFGHGSGELMEADLEVQGPAAEGDDQFSIQIHAEDSIHMALIMNVDAAANLAVQLLQKVEAYRKA